MKLMSKDEPPFWQSRGAIVLLGFGAIAAFLMFSEHRAHFLGVLPYLLIFVCPLMHLFMHHGHGHQRHDGARTTDVKGSEDERAN
jgi:hypothetical protein